jgi:uncharacterized protein
VRKVFAICFAFILAIVAYPVFASGQSVNETKLHSAAANDDVVTIKDLLSRGVNIETKDGHGRTALLIATHGNKINAAKALIEVGANVNAKDSINDSPYLYAGARGHLEILRMTLAHGADLKATNRYGGTALIPASERGHVETVRTLIEAGVDVDHVNNLGWTALIEAIILGDGGSRHQQIVDLLVKTKANVNLAAGQGVTPLQHARQRGYEEIEQILAAAGAR